MTPKKLKRTKTLDRLLSLNESEKNQIGIQIEDLIKNELNYIVNLYLRKYKNAALNTFGWDQDDLLQHIRIIMFKAVATYDGGKNAKMTTYVSRVLYYQMANFSKKCKSKKNLLSQMYFPDVIFDCEETMTVETSEDWAIYTQNFKILQDNLTPRETKVLLRYLAYGDSVTRMIEVLKLDRIVIVSCLKSIKVKMKKYMEG